MKKKVFIATVLLLVLASCVMIKKRYMSGYRIFSRHEMHQLPLKTANIKKNHDEANREEIRGNVIVASKENSNLLLNNYNQIQPDEIKHNAEQQIENQNFIKSRFKKSKLVYKKGKVKKKHSPPENTHDPWELTGKSKTVAIILCVLLGTLGIHRFYLGYTGMGCLYLLTGGLFFVGCGMDLVRLATDNLGPKIPERVQSQIEHEIKSSGNLSGSPLKNNIVAEPVVEIKDAKNGIVELNLIYQSNFVGKSLIGFNGLKYSKDEINDPYYMKMPAYDSVKTHQVLTERCQSLGFKRYKKFSGFKKECVERTTGATGICTKYKAVIECQCTN